METHSPYSWLENPMNRGVWWATVHEVAELDTTERLTHTNILAWEIPRTEEPGGLQSWGHKRVRHNLVTKQLQFQEGRTKSNVMSPKWSAQLAWSGAKWDSAGNVFFFNVMAGPHFMILIICTSSSWQDREVWNIHPQEPWRRDSVPHFQDTAPCPMPISPASTHAPKPASQAEKGRVVFA